jgi:hypothetical protein
LSENPIIDAHNDKAVMKISNCTLPILLALAFLFAVCIPWTVFSDQGGITQTIKNAIAPFNERTEVTATDALPISTVLVGMRYHGKSFWTETRKDQIERFQCAQCHKNDQAKVTVIGAAAMAHGNIFLDHGGKDRPLSCFTCHSEKSRDFLITEKKEMLDMDHSYRLCGQCHFRQEKDWLGGAHGKRVANWAGKRVVKNCTGCHDPHSPLFKKQWPKTYSPPSTK